MHLTNVFSALGHAMYFYRLSNVHFVKLSNYTHGRD